MQRVQLNLKLNVNYINVHFNSGRKKEHQKEAKRSRVLTAPYALIIFD